MLLGWMVTLRVRGEAAIGQQIAGATFFERCVEPVCKLRNPFGLCHACLAAPARQVVREAAAGDDQHAFLSERRDCSADFQVVAGTELALHGQLHHRDVGVRPGEHQWHPGSVIETPCGIRGRWKSRLGEEIDDPVGKLRVTRRGIGQLIERLRKACEVVDRPVAFDRIDGGNARFPVRGNHQDRAGPRQGGRETLEEVAGGDILEGQRRRAVREEQRADHVIQSFCFRGLPMA